MNFKNCIKPFIISFTVALIALTGYAFVGNSHYFEVVKNIDLYANLYKELNENYVDDVEPAKLMRTGVDAMLASLDPYTNYITEAQIEGYKLQYTGAAGNIGVTLEKHGKDVVITEIIEDLSAHVAGMKVGDKIIAIDGKSAKGRKVEEIMPILKGQPGSEVKVTIQRPGAAKEQTFKAIRDKADPTSVPHYGMIDEHTGYIKLKGFTQNCSGEVAKAFKDLKANNELTNLVFDLRSNGGGLLSEAINTTNIFIGSGELVVSTKGKTEEWKKEYKTNGQPLAPDMPLVILTNGRSASASEIVSGVVQDLDRGIVVGTRTFGKGLVQATRDIGYNAKVKLTTAKYYTPSGRCVQAIDYSGNYKDGAVKVPDSLRTAFKTRNGRSILDGSGVDPDVEIEQPELAQVTEALLKNHHLFNFATEYCLKHDSIPPVADFKLTDADFKDFTTFVAGKSYDYETETEKVLAKIRTSAEADKYTDAVAETLTKLEAKIKQEKQQDLQKNKDEIMRLLTKEIVARYYYQKGEAELGLIVDPEVKKALELFADKTAYDAILKGE